MDKWIATLPDELQVIAKREALVTGGCIASMCLGEKINDYDIYFKSLDAVHRIALHYVDRFNEASPTTKGNVAYTPTVKTEKVTNLLGQSEDRVLIYMKSAGVAGAEQEGYQYFETQPPEATDDFMASLAQAESEMDLVEETLALVKDPKNEYKPVFLTNNAISLTDKVQLIIRFFGSAEEIHRNFDFVHCQGVYDYAADKLHISEETLLSLMSKQLIYSGSLYPIASVFRCRKFLKRGWNISAGQMLKMLSQIRHVNWEDPRVLNEQLTGVDVAYMNELITALQNREKGQRIDTMYLAQLIDTIFED